MDALATVVGCFTAVVPLVVIAAAVATLDYRISGTRRDEALSRSLAGLLLSIGWGLSLAGLIVATHWLRDADALLPRTSVLALTATPVVMGVLPSGLLLLLAYGPSSGTPDRRPTWRDWVEQW